MDPVFFFASIVSLTFRTQGTNHGPKREKANHLFPERILFCFSPFFHPAYFLFPA
jgi:hypothetical protein